MRRLPSKDHAGPDSGCCGCVCHELCQLWHHDRVGCQPDWKSCPEQSGLGANGKMQIQGLAER